MLLPEKLQIQVSEACLRNKTIFLLFRSLFRMVFEFKTNSHSFSLPDSFHLLNVYTHRLKDKQSETHDQIGKLEGSFARDI